MHTEPLRCISPSSHEKLTRESRAKMQTLSQDFERIHDPVSSTRKRCSSAESHETFHRPIDGTHIKQLHRCSMFPVDHHPDLYNDTYAKRYLLLGELQAIEVIICVLSLRSVEFRLMRCSVTLSQHEHRWKHVHLQIRSSAMSVAAA